jgi:glycosyltransferase involved in cell wall biosynthesis
MALPESIPLKRSTLSVALITHDEEANLPRTLGSLRRADEVVIVDSGSRDATLDIARLFGASIFEESWKGYAAQKNSAIEHCTGDWILSLDADEEISPELAQEIEIVLAEEQPVAAYWIPRLNHFLGRPLRHGGFWPDRKLRLFRRGMASFIERPVHETLQANGPLGQLNSPLLHYCYPTLEEYIEHMNRYSSLGATVAVAKGKNGRSIPGFLVGILLNPAATFIYNYIVRLGFMDGREGLLMHLNHSAYIQWKYAKAWQTLHSMEKHR